MVREKICKLLKYDLTELFEVEGVEDGICSAIAKLEKCCGLETENTQAKHIYGNHSFIVETNNFWYKKYNNRRILDHLAREILAKEYQRLGITWELFSSEKNGRLLDFERRQKLSVAHKKDAPFDEILCNFSCLLQNVEEGLELQVILEQLKQHKEFDQVAMLKLTRAEVNKYSDYAFFGKHTILLDDADFCIVPLDANLNIVDVPLRKRLKINTKRGTFYFDPMDATTINWKMHCPKTIQDNLIRHQIYKGWEFNLA